MPLSKYNFGCGNTKFKDFINIDIDSALEPDLILDFLKFPYPLESNSASHIFFFHTIEHIVKNRHPNILAEFHRILHEDGKLVISYPEFSKVAQHWLDNRFGWRVFWEATIYGRQDTDFDYHVSAMYTPEFMQLLGEIGFNIVETRPENGQEFNTVVICSKGTPGVSREQGVLEEIWSRKLEIRDGKKENK